MEERKLRNKWTEENINYLKTAYLQGSPLKRIASQLNRSVTAINKVLARHNLRTHTRIERIQSLPHKKNNKLPQKKPLGTQSRKKVAQTVKFINPDDRHWVLFERVLSWMRSQKISVMKSDRDIYYEVNGYPKNEQQILLIANLLREQQHLPIFFVKGVTCL